MIDFTNMPHRNKTYSGANGSKISVVYNNELYMLKFPAPTTRKQTLAMQIAVYQNILGVKSLKV